MKKCDSVKYREMQKHEVMFKSKKPSQDCAGYEACPNLNPEIETGSRSEGSIRVPCKVKAGQQLDPVNSDRVVGGRQPGQTDFGKNL